MFVGVSLIEDFGEDSSLLVSKRGEAERLMHIGRAVRFVDFIAIFSTDIV